MNTEFIECEQCGSKVSFDEYISDESGCHFFCSECWDAMQAEAEAEERRAYEQIKQLKSILEDNNVEYTVHCAQTRSTYFYCSFAPVIGQDDDGDDVYGETIEFKVRYSDHTQLYDADINVAMTESNLDGCSIDKFDSILKNYLKNNC